MYNRPGGLNCNSTKSRLKLDQDRAKAAPKQDHNLTKTEQNWTESVLKHNQNWNSFKKNVGSK